MIEGYQSLKVASNRSIWPRREHKDICPLKKINCNYIDTEKLKIKFL